MKEINEKALKIVEQQYNSFINLPNNWDFFRGLAEYTKTIQNMTQTRPLIDALETQRKIERTAYELMNNKAMQELTQSAQRLTSIAQNVLKPYEPLIKQSQEIFEKFQPVMKAVQEVQDRINGNLLSSNPLYGLDSDLFDVARFVKASGYEEAVKEFEDNEKPRNNIYGNYTFSPTYEKINEEEQKLQRKEQVEPWGAWFHLPLVKQFIFEPDELQAEFKAEAEADPNLKWTYLNFVGILNELEKMRKGELTDNDIFFFRIKDFKSYAQRFHSYLVTELIKAGDNVQKTELRFDDISRTLYFMNEKILIAKKEESDPHKLIRTIFKDVHKVWPNDEILEDWGYSFDEKISKNKVYQSGKVVNKTIAQETKIKDFLIITTKTVAINEKYLKK